MLKKMPIKGMAELKVISFALILAGIIGILSAIIVNPEFATKYISSDNHIGVEGIELLQHYRLLSLISGCLLLLIGIMFFIHPEKYLVFPYALAYRTFFMAVVVFLVLFGYNTLTRTIDFGDFDTMNFVDIARNIANGRGISQSALGFNVAHFSADDQIPMPLTAQPPLYPLMIALVSRLGISYAYAGFLISIICYGIILFLAYRLTLELYDIRAAPLAVGLLMLYFPLYRVSRTTFSEGLSIVCLLTSFWILIRMCRSTTHHIRIPAAAGLATGLAFATRYALLPLFPLGIVFIFLESSRKLRDLGLYLVGFITPAGLVLGRNLFVSGEILPNRNPSTVAFHSNAIQAIEVVTREYSNMLKPDVQAILLVISLVVLGILLAVKHKLLAAIQHVFIKKGRYLLTLWVVGYLAYLVYVRTMVHLDPINWRLIMPAGIMLVLLFAALVIKATEVKAKYIICIAMIIAIFMIKHEARITAIYPIYDQDQLIARSERLSWVAKHTTEKDLIIADGAVDIAFYFARPAVISFSPYPESDIAEYTKIMAFCNKHCTKYENIYLIIHPPDYLISHAPDMQDATPDNQETNMKRAYGPFITDIIFGNLQNYPDVTFLERLSDAYIYKIRCRL